MKYGVFMVLFCTGCVWQLRAEPTYLSPSALALFRQANRQADAQVIRGHNNGTVSSAVKSVYLKEQASISQFRTRAVEMHKAAVKQEKILRGYANQSQSVTTKQTYGSMTVPVKTVTVDVYQETSVEIEQIQQQIAVLMAKIKQLQQMQVKVKPRYKVVVR